jgi:predicted RNase H-like HicB family nuclease
MFNRFKRTVTYEIKLLKSEEGFAFWCPALPGCASQGETEQEALENLKDAISEYLAVEDPRDLANTVTRTVEAGHTDTFRQQLR